MMHHWQSFANPHSALKTLSITLIAAGLASACSKPGPAANANTPPPTPVKLQTITSGTIEETSEFVGSLEAPQKVTLQPQIQGRIESIVTPSGQQVGPGTLIMTLSADQTQANVAQANAAVGASRAAQGTAEAQLAANVAARDKAAANVQLRESDFNRYKQLADQGATPQQQLDVARNNLQTAIADLRAAQKQVDASQAAVRQAGANVSSAQAQVAANEVNVNFKRITAPVAGVVGDFPVKVGDYVNTGQTLTTITQTNAFDLNLSIPSNRSAQLRNGLPVELIDPNTNKQLSVGAIGFIAATADPSQQTVLSKGRFPNSNGQLRDGQYVRARVIWNRKPGVLVPTEAISRIGGQSFVYVTQDKTDNGKTQTVAHQVPVTVGDIQGQSYQVLQGLKAGDSVIVSGVSKLREGAPVAPQPAQS